jgi:acyl-CoA dehydrogenase
MDGDDMDLPQRNGERQSAADIAAGVVPALAKFVDDVDRLGRFPEEGMRALRQTPLMGLLVPAEHGGLGGSLVDLVKVSAVLAAGCPVTTFIWAMHCQQVDVLARYAAPDLAAPVLRRVASGELYLGSVTTEPGSGGRLLVSDSPARRCGDYIEFERSAPIVTGARHADAFLITLRSSEDAPRGSVTLVYADRAEVQVTESREWDMLGMRGTENISAQLCGRVPARQVVGGDGGFGTVAVESLIPAGHVAWAACWISSARVALEQVVRHLRKQAANPGDASFDLKAVRLARIRMALEVAQTYLLSVASEVDATRAAGVSLRASSTQIHLNTLKVVASETSYDVANQLIELCGFELGYTRGGPRLEQLLRDLRSAAINYSNDKLLSATGRLVLMDPASVSSWSAVDRLTPGEGGEPQR